MAIEAFTDPKTGERRLRRHLGVCLSGRLYAVRRPQGVDLLWTGLNLSRALDRGLERLIATAPQLKLLGNGIWWLCRLAQGDYVLEEGGALYQLLDPAQVQAQQRRHASRVKNIGNRSRAMLDITPKTKKPPARACEAADAAPPLKPRLTRPAA